MLGTGEMNCILSSTLKLLVDHKIVRFVEMFRFEGECYILLLKIYLIFSLFFYDFVFYKVFTLFIIDYWNAENNARTPE